MPSFELLVPEMLVELNPPLLLLNFPKLFDDYISFVGAAPPYISAVALPLL
jgi:hypothetical protein